MALPNREKCPATARTPRPPPSARVVALFYTNACAPRAETAWRCCGYACPARLLFRTMINARLRPQLEMKSEGSLKMPASQAHAKNPTISASCRTFLHERVRST